MAEMYNDNLCFNMYLVPNLEDKPWVCNNSNDDEGLEFGSDSEIDCFDWWRKTA